MSIFSGLEELLSPDRLIPALAGIAGAAAMAATDWRSPARLAQHVFVGTLTSSVATPVFAPAISKALGLLAVDPSAHSNASAFLVGAFGIYFFEFAREFWKAKTKHAEKELRNKISIGAEDVPSAAEESTGSSDATGSN